MSNLFYQTWLSSSVMWLSQTINRERVNFLFLPWLFVVGLRRLSFLHDSSFEFWLQYEKSSDTMSRLWFCTIPAVILLLSLVPMTSSICTHRLHCLPAGQLHLCNHSVWFPSSIMSPNAADTSGTNTFTK